MKITVFYYGIDTYHDAHDIVLSLLVVVLNFDLRSVVFRSHCRLLDGQIGRHLRLVAMLIVLVLRIGSAQRLNPELLVFS